MASLKEIKGRIASVNSTLKITSAMKMVASAKLRKAQNAIGNTLAYQKLLGSILAELLSDEGGRTDTSSSAFVTPRDEVRSVALVCISSNSSLCGGFNANAIREAVRVLREYEAGGVKVDVYPIGKRIADALRKIGYSCPVDYSHIAASPDYDDAATLGSGLVDAFLEGKYDRVEFVYNHFKNAGSQPTVHETYLPLSLDRAPTSGQRNSTVEFIVEPDRASQVQYLLPNVLRLRIYTVILDAQIAEHAARTLAMQTATDNGRDLLAQLTLEYNKGRQQKITNEILDLEGGSTRE